MNQKAQPQNELEQKKYADDRSFAIHLGSGVNGDILGRPGLARQNSVLGPVLVGQSLVDLHRHFPRQQQQGRADAARPDAAREIDVHARLLGRFEDRFVRRQHGGLLRASDSGRRFFGGCCPSSFRARAISRLRSRF